MTKPLDWYRDRVDYTNITGLSGIRRLPREGKIKLGMKVANPKKNPECRKQNHPNEEMCFKCSYPKDLDYFVVPREVQKVYGEKPKELDIFFPSENQAQIHPQSLRWYKGPRLMCKGDGLKANRVDINTGQMKIIDCPCEHYNVDCFPRSSLMVMLPKVTMNGVYQIDTGSTSNIIEINSAIEYYQNFLLGRIAFVPLKLKRMPTKIMTPDQKQVTKNLLKLEFAGNIEDVARFRRADAIGQIRGAEAETRALPPPEEEEENGAPEIEVIQAEGVLPKEMTPPDQAPEKEDPPPMREPGADEEEDDLPFPEETQPEEEPARQIPQELFDDPIGAWLKEAGSKAMLKDRFRDDVVRNPSLSPEQKAHYQKIYDECYARLKR